MITLLLSYMMTVVYKGRIEIISDIDFKSYLSNVYYYENFFNYLASATSMTGFSVIYLPIFSLNTLKCSEWLCASTAS